MTGELDQAVDFEPCASCGVRCGSQFEFIEENGGRPWEICSGCMPDPADGSYPSRTRFPNVPSGREDVNDRWWRRMNRWTITLRGNDYYGPTIEQLGRRVAEDLDGTLPLPRRSWAEALQPKWRARYSLLFTRQSGSASEAVALHSDTRTMPSVPDRRGPWEL